MNTELLEKALRSDNPFEEIRNLLKTMIAQGYEREKLVQELINFALRLRAENREKDDDLILEMVDFLTGWCSSHMKI